MTARRPAVVTVLVLVAIVGGGMPALAAEPPAAITDQSRNVDQTNDFPRIIFLRPGAAQESLWSEWLLEAIASGVIWSAEFQALVPQLRRGSEGS